jgi:hypothetical protein
MYSARFNQAKYVNCSQQREAGLALRAILSRLQPDIAAACTITAARCDVTRIQRVGDACASLLFCSIDLQLSICFVTGKFYKQIRLYFFSTKP